VSPAGTDRSPSPSVKGWRRGQPPRGVPRHRLRRLSEDYDPRRRRL